MKIRSEACLLGILLVSALSGCAKSCYTSNDTVLSQTIIGDAAYPDAAGVKFPFDTKLVPTACQTQNAIRVEMNINPYGYVQDVFFLDPWQNDCAKEYTRVMKSSKLVEAPLERSLEHYRVDLHISRVSSRQCISLR